MRIRPQILVPFVFLVMLGMQQQSCLKSKRPGIPAKVVKVIAETGINRVELNKTIGHFFDKQDSIFLHSVYFIIQNLPHQYAVTYSLTDFSDSLLDFNLNQFDTYEELKQWWFEQKYHKNGIRYKPKKYTLDRDTITAELLISTIKLAIKSRSYPWAKTYSEKDFFEFVLPHRFGNEAIHDWRSKANERFSWIMDSVGYQEDPSKLIRFVNAFVNTNFVFDKRYLKQPEPQQFDEILQTKKGNYQDLAYLKAMLLRTFGIPATIDYVPYLADTTGSYYFAVAKNASGQFEPLLPSQTEYLFEEHKIPKVYRRIYTDNPNSLFALKDLSMKTPPFIGHYYYNDVTHEYIPVSSFRFPVKRTDTIYYAAVFNDSSWRAIDWTLSYTDEAVFSELGSNISYRIMLIVNDSLVFE